MKNQITNPKIENNVSTSVTNQVQTENVSTLIIPAPRLAKIRLRAIGITPLLCNNGKHLTKTLLQTQPVKGDNTVKGNTRKGEPYDPEGAYNRARYRFDDKSDGFPAHRVRDAAIVTAHTFVPEVSKVFVRGAMFVLPEPEGDGWLLRIDSQPFPPIMSELPERVGGKGKGTGTPQPRWRPRYDQWTMPFTVQFLENLITLPNLVNLLNYAGMCAGIGEHRPEKGGDLGTFRVVSEDQWQESISSGKEI